MDGIFRCSQGSKIGLHEIITVAGRKRNSDPPLATHPPHSLSSTGNVWIPWAGLADPQSPAARLFTGSWVS